MTPEHKLRALVGNDRRHSHPIMSSDIERLQLDSDLVEILQEAFSSKRSEDVSLGFLFLDSLLQRYGPTDFPGSFFERFVPQIRSLIFNNNAYLRYRALELFVWLRENYSDYREVMLNCLLSDDIGCNKIAIHHYETYAKSNEVSLLIRFHDNAYAADFAMNSPLRYELRDAALSKISSMVGVDFCKKRLSEPNDETEVGWWDWKPFFEWWSLNKDLWL